MTSAYKGKILQLPAGQHQRAAVDLNQIKIPVQLTLVCPSFIQADVQKVKAVRQQDHTDLSSLQLPDLTAWWT